MNIKQAKQQIQNAMKAYFTKDTFGNYKIPIERQRPIFLMGPPGIGKTAIMEQVASELGVGLVSYSMTHHTRQSALGLPFIEKKTYGGQEYSVSEYTMSEIIASVYDMMEQTGIREGILFLDEINCVSETLAPAMLQFLQYKIFGRHRVPDGWIVVTAGNPPEYNNSVREFDIVTWDRLKRIDVEPDYQVWKEYAYKKGIHPAILTYLDIKTADFYRIETTVDGKTFVTARGWSDLSDMIQLYEEHGLAVDELLIAQYLQNKRISKEFAIYYDLFNKYRSDYADEALMVELTKTAPSWRSSVSGNDAPPLYTFRQANAYSNTRAAMLFAEKYGELDVYAKIRNMTEDAIRDQFLSNIGIDENGAKVYDLGNQVVTARLQADLTFIIELPNGKTAKSLPKKGADEEKYAKANADYAAMKKDAKKIVKNRADVLFQDFLSGRTRPAEDWSASYLHNPLLRSVAELLVWSQGDETFTLKDGQPINYTEQTYIIGDAPIAVAHPMEMTENAVAAWQKYFTKHGIKQPFAQIWEPVVEAKSITTDRYKDAEIPFFRFLNQKKHGIYVEDEDFHSTIYIGFADCDADVDRIDYERHNIEPTHRFEVTKFKFKKYTRQVNHIVSLLDKWTVYDRILKDDVSIVAHLPQFTLAQITDFIKLASENNCTNCTAALLEYKNTHFADFDPMAEFTLE